MIGEIGKRYQAPESCTIFLGTPDLHHLSARIAEQHGAPGTGESLGQFDNPDRIESRLDRARRRAIPFLRFRRIHGPGPRSTSVEFSYVYKE